MRGGRGGREKVYTHLLSSENQALLDRWDAFFFFYALLYAGDLWVG